MHDYIKFNGIATWLPLYVAIVRFLGSQGSIFFQANVIYIHANHCS